MSIYLFYTALTNINILLVPMKNTNFQNDSFHPEEELRFLSMTEHLQTHYFQQKNSNCKWDIQPWKDQHENPSQSPERRKYTPRPAPLVIKIEKPTQIKTARTSKNVLEPTNACNSSFRVKTSGRRSSNAGDFKYQMQNKPQIKTIVVRKQSVNRSTPIKVKKQSEGDEINFSYHTPVNLIVYPMVNDNKKKRLFRKMDKFQNFVSVSLRK